MASSRIFHFVLILCAFLVIVSAQNVFDWINPPPEPVNIESQSASENQVWELGSIQILKWSTSYLVLRRLTLVQVAPDLANKEIHIDVDVQRNGLGEQVYDWKVVLNGLDLYLSPVFYFYVTPVDDDGFEQRPVVSERINITDPTGGHEPGGLTATPRPTGTAPVTSADHFNQTSTTAIDSAGTREPLGSRLSHGAVTALSVVASVVGVFMLAGLGFICWQRVSGKRIARLGPNEEVIGPNEGYLRQVYLSPMYPAQSSRDGPKEKEEDGDASYELQEKKT